MDFNSQYLDQGTPLEITITGQDADGNLIPFDESWEWDCAVRIKCQTGAILDRVPLALTESGKLTGMLSTSDWVPGIYWYDVRLKAPDGTPYPPSERTRLELGTAITPPI